jgi:hypothetical protein
MDVCEFCREQVDRNDPGVVRAFEVVKVTTFGPKTESLDGLPVLFHRDHFPHGSRDYRLAGEES